MKGGKIASNRGMRIIFSRKGFDSAAGGGPSPIVDGRPISLPIPAGVASNTSYGDLGLGDLVATASRGKLSEGDLCHHDPMFCDDGQCYFGQCGAAQSHLANNGVTIGDVFVFFGLFGDERTGERHHRIFGYQRIERMVVLSQCKREERQELISLNHPHALAMHGRNDVIYVGTGRMARAAHPELRLTVEGGPLTLWRVPEWLKETGLTYHARPDRWETRGLLQSVARGQEFVSDIGENAEAKDWLDNTLKLLA